MADQGSPGDALLRVIQLREELDRIAEGLAAPQLFDPVSLPIPRLDPAELGFIRSVAYMFVLYYEAGEVAVPYLLTLWDGFGLDGSGGVREHRPRIGRLRTYLQHNLSPASSTDRETRDVCERWFVDQCATPVPSSEEQWRECLTAILHEAEEFLRTMVACLRAVEADEGREGILEDWRFRLSRYHPPEAFDEVIAESANDLGRAHVDVVRLRKRYYDQWMERLSYLSGEYDFRTEARRLIEAALLLDVSAGMPVTGKDVIEEFGLSPGPDVGAALALARRLYEEEPMDRARLLTRLRAELSGEGALREDGSSEASA